MKSTPLCINDSKVPQILESSDDYILVYKPPRMHSVPGKGENSLAEWCILLFPELTEIPGRNASAKKGEGGLLHRLDYETQGLVLFARNQASYDFFLQQQKEGKLIKEYGALVKKISQSQTANRPLGSGLPDVRAQGFPPFEKTFLPPVLPDEQNPFVIESFFRPYGPGRKYVRPEKMPFKNASDPGKKCRTEIIEIIPVSTGEGEGVFYIRLRLLRGFRHQIRCHLSWAGFPVLNDPLYQNDPRSSDSGGILALRAEGLRFFAPSGGELFFYIPPLEFAVLV